MTETSPAMIAVVTNLDVSRQDKAPIDTPRRSMGHFLGDGVRFGMARDCLAAGDGIETILSLRSVMPNLPMIAALSSAHLSAVLFPAKLRRFYAARDKDRAGDNAASTLVERAWAAGIETIILSPSQGDFNDDLRAFGAEGLRASLRDQLASEDITRFLEPVASVGEAA